MTQPSDQERERWHLDKRIPIATLVTLLVLTIGGVLHIAEIRKDVELLREQQRAMVDRMDRRDSTTDQSSSEMRRWLERMEAKLDKLVEKAGNGVRH